MNKAFLLGLAMLLGLVSSASFAEDKAEEVKKARPAEDFLILPLRIYRLKAEDVPDVHCYQLTDADIRRIIEKVNLVWSSAGIFWDVEFIKDAPAQNTARFKLAGIADEKEAPEKKKNARKSHLIFRDVIPDETRRDFAGFRIYYIHDFDVNGVYFGRREAMVKETAALRPVEDGIDEPLPRVSSHELGHGLGLPHRQDRINLLASGTTGTLFNTDEIAKTRENAEKNEACLKFADLLKKAEAETDPATKNRLTEAAARIKAMAGGPVHPLPDAMKALKTRLESAQPAK
ncbi:MAG: Matrixin [Isosphaeraceae bacterium]